jgi:hypothetical protein
MRKLARAVHRHHRVAGIGNGKSAARASYERQKLRTSAT